MESGSAAAGESAAPAATANQTAAGATRGPWHFTWSGSAPGDDVAPPGGAFGPALTMFDLMDKLRLLGFDANGTDAFASAAGVRKAIPQHYFAVGASAGEQFHVFTTMAAWLARRAGQTDFEMPAEGHDVDFAPNKLKSGCGDQCLYVLDKLSDSALANAYFSWNKWDMVDFIVRCNVAGVYVAEYFDPKASLQPETEETLEAEADEAEITAEQFEEDEAIQAADDSDDDNAPGTFLDLQNLGGGQNFRGNFDEKGVQQGFNEKQQTGILKSDTDTAAWRQEVERVQPSLKIAIRQDAKDWRGHLEQMQQYKETMDDLLKTTKLHLGRVATDVQRAMEKIHSREKYLNGQLESLLSQGLISNFVKCPVK